ncbi:MAG: hypothetical protein EBT03_13030 [Betaproteobacteria bacterium]|nr:hypothetical protein [Betaproteobacteria bacterium]
MCGLTHLLPAETPDMKKALADMKASYKDVFGTAPMPPGFNPVDRAARSVSAFVAMRNSPYWLALEGLLKPNYLGAEWLESWGHDGSASEHVPFPDIDELYYLDEKNHVRAKKRLYDYLDLWAPGWRGSLGSQLMKAFEVLKPAKVAAYSPAAIAARLEAEKKAKAQAAAGASAKAQAEAQAKARAQRATLATGGAVVAVGALAYLWTRRKNRG